MGFSIGEDLVSAFIVALLLSFSVLFLIQTQRAQGERLQAMEDFNSSVDAAEQLRDQVLAGGTPGLIELSSGRVENFSKRTSLYVEVRSLRGDVLFSYGQKPEQARGVSLPVAVNKWAGSAAPCELLVWVRRD